MRLGTAMALELVAPERMRSDEDQSPKVEGIVLERQGFLRVKGLDYNLESFSSDQAQNIQRKSRYFYIFP